MYKTLGMALGWLLLSLPQAADVSAKHHGIKPFVHDQYTSRDDKVLVLEFTASDCSYCLVLEEEVLRPYLLSGDLHDKMRLRSVEAHGTSANYAFNDGKLLTGKQLGEHYGVRYTPTLVFLDSNGRQLAEPLHGVSNLEFYGYYLTQRVNEAYANLTELANAN